VIWIVAIAGAALALIVLACAAALVEVFRQLSEIRGAINLMDEPIPLNLKSGELRTDDIGLPGELAVEPQAIVIFLSLKCSTCLTVAEAFHGGSPATVWFVIQSSPRSSMLSQMLADSAERVIFDEDDQIAMRLGLNVTPSVLTTSFGEIMRAQGVSSARQVLNMVPTLLPRDATVPTRHQMPASSNQSA
jgi:hypothetical protein